MKITKVLPIRVFGAREHNLKNIDVTIPKNSLTVITGPSGSGKSSLALDILYVEGKRRYTESLSSYARQFLGIDKKPEVDRIEGLCPAIAIEQKTVGSNPRSTVGTITEIYDYLRVLFARIGIAHCIHCSKPVTAQSPESIALHIETLFAGKEVTITAPVAVDKKGEFKQELRHFFEQGFYQIIIDGTSYTFRSLDEIETLTLKKTYKHTIDIVIDTIVVDQEERSRLYEAIEKAETYAQGLTKVIAGDVVQLYSSKRMCTDCGIAFPELEPRFFSYNSPIGACKKCSGLGVVQAYTGMFDFYKQQESQEDREDEVDAFEAFKVCDACDGQRLNQHARAVTINYKNIAQLAALSIGALATWMEHLALNQMDFDIAQTLLDEIKKRLSFLTAIGLSYITLSRTARTLSGGEGQRIRLATQLGSALTGVLYILDEPSIGLHQRDNDQLIATLKMLRDLGNTVIVVEHDTDTMLHADYIVDMGPGGGTQGGLVTAAGSPREIMKNTNSLTGAYLAGRATIEVPALRRTPESFLILKHARKNNLKDITVRFPLGVLTCVSGVSGSGKSTLVLEELAPAIATALKGSRARVVPTLDLVGIDQIVALTVVTQTPIGRTSRSNPATYLGIFDDIRALFAQLPESRIRGYTVGRFSFNQQEGRCRECSGHGTVTIEMHFLADVVMECKQCKGKRYNRETLQIVYKRKNIFDVLDMTVYEALEFFKAHKTIAKRLELLDQVGLSYLKLGQPSTTLSGGEAQRIKLVDELAKRGNKTFYILDEPTTGLHSDDIKKLLQVLNQLVAKGNTVLVIEHNLDVLKSADYIIDLGPEAGEGGGTIVAEGRPEVIAKSRISKTAVYLKRALKGQIQAE